MKYEYYVKYNHPDTGEEMFTGLCRDFTDAKLKEVMLDGTIMRDGEEVKYHTNGEPAQAAHARYAGSGEAVAKVELSHGGYPVIMMLARPEDVREGALLYTHPAPSVPDDVYKVLKKTSLGSLDGTVMMHMTDYNKIVSWVNSLLDAPKEAK